MDWPLRPAAKLAVKSLWNLNNVYYLSGMEGNPSVWKTPARKRSKEHDINHGFQKLSVMSVGLGIHPNGGGKNRRFGKTPEIIKNLYTIYCSGRLHTRRYVRLWRRKWRPYDELIKHCIMNACGEMLVAPTFMTSVDRGEWTASSSGRVNPGKSPLYLLDRRLVLTLREDKSCAKIYTV